MKHLRLITHLKRRQQSRPPQIAKALAQTPADIESVDHTKIYEGGNIGAKFKFSDKLCHIAEYVEINKQSAAG